MLESLFNKVADPEHLFWRISENGCFCNSCSKKKKPTMRYFYSKFIKMSISKILSCEYREIFWNSLLIECVWTSIFRRLFGLHYLHWWAWVCQIHPSFLLWLFSPLTSRSIGLNLVWFLLIFLDTMVFGLPRRSLI